ncbi:MAG TPA: hypothetical protein VIK74_06410, partial [Parasegetibacter sp.]
IAGFRVISKSHDFPNNPVLCKMIDPAQPVTVDENGRLSRKLTTVIFEYRVNFPKTFQNDEFNIEFEITTGKGEVKVVSGKCSSVDFLVYNTVMIGYNGQVTSGQRGYATTAPCFLGFQTNFTTVRDETVNPPVDRSVPTSITGFARTPAAALTTASIPNVYAHIYTDITDFEKRTMYLVSPDTEWIGDSLRILNNYLPAYPAAQMNKVSYVDLGAIDFINLKSSDFDGIDFNRDGKSMVRLYSGHSYAFKTREDKIAIIYVKNIQIYSPAYNRASPTAYFHIKVQL